MGMHYLDPVQYLLDKDNTSPVEIEADCTQQHPDACGSWRRIELKYSDGCKMENCIKDLNTIFLTLRKNWQLFLILNHRRKTLPKQ